MSSDKQNDELERIQDRLNRARTNRNEAAVPPASTDSSVTSRIRPSAGSTVASGSSGTSSQTPGAWESISIASPGSRTKKLTSPLQGIRKTFTKAASSRRIVAQDQSINLRGQDAFAPAMSPDGSRSMFSRDSSSRNIGPAPFADEYNDAAPNTESEEYIDSDKSRNRLSPIMAQIVGLCMDCYTSVAYHADRLYLNCARGGDKSKLVNIIIIIIAALAGIFGVVHFSKGSSSPSPVPASAPTPNDSGSSEFTPLPGRTGEFQKVIANAGVTPGELMSFKNTFEYAALDWIANKDEAKLDHTDPGLIERYILALLYFGTNPDEWFQKDGWMTGAGHCSWFGIECVPIDDSTKESGISRSYDANAAITGIALKGNNLKGSVPDEFGKLTNTLTIDLGDNALSGTLPEFHESLKYLLVPNNEIHGTFPHYFKLLTNLHGLDLSNNAMDGYISNDIDKLTNLRTLDLSYNQFVGSFPHIQDLTKITKLHLQHNSFGGTIPGGKLREYERLEILRLDNNTFTGPFPKQSIERLSRIEYIDLSNNDLTGSLPDIFQSNRRLLTFHVNNNRFRAKIPSSLMKLSGLKSLRLDHNFLTGRIPDEVSLLADVHHLNLHDNLLTGQIPTFIGFPADFTFISLKKNKLTGTIPSEMGNLFRLTHLELDTNQLTGTVPTELAALTSLQNLYLQNNNFEGITMPTALCDRMRRGEMTALTSDCSDTDKVVCECCSQCYPLPSSG